MISVWLASRDQVFQERRLVVRTGASLAWPSVHPGRAGRIRQRVGPPLTV